MTYKPWEKEYDSYQKMVDDYHLVILRGPVGTLNGYVGVPRTHPLYATLYTHDALVSVDVHGGLTYSDYGVGGAETKNHYYFGFDTAHGHDLSPFWGKLNSPEAVYRDVDYVKKEVMSLMKQLQELENKKGV